MCRVHSRAGSGIAAILWQGSWSLDSFITGALSDKASGEEGYNPSSISPVSVATAIQVILSGLCLDHQGSLWY
jgi:hypothetical protein